jgi:hypothetical protein
LPPPLCTALYFEKGGRRTASGRGSKLKKWPRITRPDFSTDVTSARSSLPDSWSAARTAASAAGSTRSSMTVKSGKAEASDCTTSKPMTVGPAALIASSRAAWVGRDQGQRPTSSILSSSIATMTTSPDASVTPRWNSLRSRAGVSMTDRVRQPFSLRPTSAKPSSSAMRRVVIPGSRKARDHSRDREGRSIGAGRPPHFRHGNWRSGWPGPARGLMSRVALMRRAGPEPSPGPGEYE